MTFLRCASIGYLFPQRVKFENITYLHIQPFTLPAVTWSLVGALPSLTHLAMDLHSASFNYSRSMEFLNTLLKPETAPQLSRVFYR